MKTKLMDSVENKSLKKTIPYFEIGDLVDVHCRITEGNKTRIQVFGGTVIAPRDAGSMRHSRSGGLWPTRAWNVSFLFTRQMSWTFARCAAARLAVPNFTICVRHSGKAVRLSHRHSEHTVSK